MSVDLACIFPNILPDDNVVFPLAHIFPRLIFLRPVEDDLPVADTPLLRALENQSEEQEPIIKYTCPAPLAQDRDPFLALLQDIRSRPDDYAGHLSHLSAGAIPVGQENEQEYSIIDTLLKQTGIRSKRKEHTPEAEKGQGKNSSQHRLWQARMLLKLGESIDIQQAEVRNNLARMTRQQDEILTMLRRAGEEGAKSAFDQAIMVTDEVSLEQQRLRLRAWSRLFALSEVNFEHTVFISLYSEAVEALVELYQHEYFCTIKPLVTLPLPVVRSEALVEQNGLFAKINDFQKKAGSMLTLLRTLLDDSTALHHAGETKQQWMDLLNIHYPVAEYGRCVLTLYFLPEVSPQEFFLRTFAPQEQSAKNEYWQKTGMILGVLQR
jgi:hypothetical protein